MTSQYLNQALKTLESPEYETQYLFFAACRCSRAPTEGPGALTGEERPRRPGVRASLLKEAEEKPGPRPHTSRQHKVASGQETLYFQAINRSACGERTLSR